VPMVKNIEKTFKKLIGDELGLYTVTDLDVSHGKLFVTTQNASETTVPNGGDVVKTNSIQGSVVWTNIVGAQESDNNRAQADITGIHSTHFLELSDFDFSIPSGSTILGIKVEVERMQSGGSTGNIRDSQIRLIKRSGVHGILNKAETNTNWSSTETIRVYGNTSDLWGESWSPEIINDSSFGVALSVTGSTATTHRFAQVDAVSITVTYIHQLYVFDVSDVLRPTLISGLGSNDEVTTGFNAVTTHGSFAYIATNSGASSGQLQIVDISQNPPTVVSTLKVPGVTGTAGQGIGKKIYYSRGYVFLGLTKTLSGPEFNIIDVSDPLFPKWIGGYSIGNAVNAIEVHNQYAYVGTPNTQELITFDISNPKNPLRVGGFNAPDDVGNGKSIYTVGNALYFGRTVTGSNPELYVLDNTHKEIMTPVVGTRDIGSSVNDIIVRDTLAFIITTHGQFQIYDIASSTNITLFTSTVALPHTGLGMAMDCESNTFFIASTPSSGSEMNASSLSIIKSNEI